MRLRGGDRMWVASGARRQNKGRRHHQHICRPTPRRVAHANPPIRPAKMFAKCSTRLSSVMQELTPSDCRNMVSVQGSTPAQRPPRPAGRSLEIRRPAVDFPIAVARRLGTVAASNFLLAIDRMPVALGAARSCLSQRTLGGWRERTLRPSLRINFCRRGRLEGRVGTGHSLHLEQARRGCKPAWMRYRDQS